MTIRARSCSHWQSGCWGIDEEAAELLQDVYLEVWRKVSRYDVGRGTPVAWLITLTKSRAIDRLRARSRTRLSGYRFTGKRTCDSSGRSWSKPA